MSNAQQLKGNQGSLAWLVEIMQRLLGPDGCPWDREQTLATLRPYLIEECYEVLDAIDSGDAAQHCEELGDLLLQIVFQSELAQIGMRDVITSIGEKLIRRHPHVFGEVHVRNSAEVIDNWESIKASEKRNQKRPLRLVDSVPRGLPALHRAHQLVGKARRAGLPGDDPRRGLASCFDALTSHAGDPQAAPPDELIGDALLHLASWARDLGVEPEQALRDALSRFEADLVAAEPPPAEPSRT